MKKLLLIPLILFAFLSSAQIQTINVGTTPGDGTGDGLRTAMQKVNANFTYAMEQMALKANTADVVPNTRTINSQPLSANITLTFTKSDVGLANVDNTSDANKPVSTATQTALDLKANLASPTFTGSPVVPGYATNADLTASEDILEASIDTKLDKAWNPVTVSGSVTLALTDIYKTLVVTNGSATTITIPLQSTTSFPTNAWFDVLWYGVGQPTVSPVSGAVTINSSSTGYTVPERYMLIQVRKIATNEWVIFNGGTPIGQGQAWVPVIGGVASQPTFVARYVKIGKFVMCQFRMTSQPTSNASTKTITLPYAAANTATMGSISVLSIVNNGVSSTVPGMAYTRVNSTTLDIYRDIAATGWTASGLCKFDLTITYESEQ